VIWLRWIGAENKAKASNKVQGLSGMFIDKVPLASGIDPKVIKHYEKQ
jgi:hypothetical protein